MLDGESKDPRTQNSHLWHQILKMTAEKQLVFVHRVLHLHDVALRRGGKAANPRLAPAEWALEADRCCFLAHCLCAMQKECNPDGTAKFSDEDMEKAFNRAIEGRPGLYFPSFGLLRDYVSDADQYIGCLDNEFKVEETSIYTDHAPDEPDLAMAKLRQADERVSLLNKDARKAQYDADTLSLARDIAQVGNLFRQVAKTESAARAEKLLHLRNQNVIGAGLVAEWMSNHMHVQAGNLKEQGVAIEKASFCRATCFKVKYMHCWPQCSVRLPSGPYRCFRKRSNLRICLFMFLVLCSFSSATMTSLALSTAT